MILVLVIALDLEVVELDVLTKVAGDGGGDDDYNIGDDGNIESGSIDLGSGGNDGRSGRGNGKSGWAGVVTIWSVGWCCWKCCRKMNVVLNGFVSIMVVEVVVVVNSSEEMCTMIIHAVSFFKM